MRILLLGGGLQAFSCAESIKAVGYETVVISHNKANNRYGFFDKHYYGSSTDESFVYDVIRNENPDVVIPMGDKEARFLSKRKNEIQERYSAVCAVPELDVLTIGADKSSLMEFCKANDISHPHTYRIDTSNIEEAACYVGFPALIKPGHSVGARGIKRVDSIDEIKKELPGIIEQYGSCSLQQLIDNKEFYYNVMLYRRADGSYSNYVVSKIVRMYPISGGSSSCCITEVNEEIIALCKRCLDLMNWTGFADFDVLYDKHSAEYKVIEINPRVPASLRAAHVSGINFPQIIISDCLGLEPPKCVYLPNKILRFLGIDILWFFSSEDRFKSKPSWFSLLGRNIYYMDVYSSEPRTWWSWLYDGIKKWLKRHN